MIKIQKIILRSGAHFTSVLHLDINYTNAETCSLGKRCLNSVPERSYWNEHWSIIMVRLRRVQSTYMYLWHVNKEIGQDECMRGRGVRFRNLLLDTMLSSIRTVWSRMISYIFGGFFAILCRRCAQLIGLLPGRILPLFHHLQFLKISKRLSQNFSKTQSIWFGSPKHIRKLDFSLLTEHFRSLYSLPMYVTYSRYNYCLTFSENYH